MKSKWRICVFLVVCIILMSNAVLQAVDTRAIDEVRDKSVLDNRDFDVIERFLREAVNELVEISDFASVAELRATIVSRSRSNRNPAQEQYRRQFFSSARKYIAGAFEKTSETGSYRYGFLVRLNLLILVAQLVENYPGLVEVALDFIDDDNAAIRYWAVRCVSGPEIVKQINSGSEPGLARQILTRLGGIIESSSFEVLKLVAEFAADVKTAEADELLVKIAERRSEQYANWTVKGEVLEATVLRGLSSKITSGSAASPRMAQRFGQLYSYAIQRYIRGTARDNVLGESSLNQLVTVLVEVEKRCISNLLDKDHNAIKDAVERGDISRLRAAHDRLLGDGTRPGELMDKLNYDYGRSADGSRLLAPLRLPEPPENENV